MPLSVQEPAILFILSVVLTLVLSLPHSPDASEASLVAG